MEWVYSWTQAHFSTDIVEIGDWALEQLKRILLWYKVQFCHVSHHTNNQAQSRENKPPVCQ